MSAIDLMFNLFALLLGFAVAELLSGLARSWRIRTGATLTGQTQIRIGWLVPLLGLLLLIDQTHFWLTAYELRNHLAFSYASLLTVLVIVGGYYVISTFVFPDDPEDWPNFDDYYLRTNRTVIAGMFAVNLGTVLYVLWLASKGLQLEDTPIARSWFRLVAASLFSPGLIILWFVKSARANLFLLIFMNGLLLFGALGPALAG